MPFLSKCHKAPVITANHADEGQTNYHICSACKGAADVFEGTAYTSTPDWPALVKSAERRAFWKGFLLGICVSIVMVVFIIMFL